MKPVTKKFRVLYNYVNGKNGRQYKITKKCDFCSLLSHPHQGRNIGFLPARRKFGTKSHFQFI